MELLKKLPMPIGMTKKDIIDLLLKEEYGYLPEFAEISTESEMIHENFCAGKASLYKITLTCKTKNGDFSFPVYYTKLLDVENTVPCFIHINFRDNVPDRYQPTEEIVDSGYSVLSFCYTDVSSDDGDFTNGLAGIIYPNGKRKPDDCGKIGLWAWAAMRVMDYAQTLPELNHTRISVCGHSRLGKTALVTGMLDERFYCAFSNDSGCCGAALSREATGENIAVITDVFPFWFCENYLKYANNDDKLPFDQHYLIAANYPHKVYVASAEGDAWATPKNEYLSCIAASSYYENHDIKGFIHPGRLPKTGEHFHDGNIGYHIRKGTHYLSREDWQNYIKYLEKE